MNASRLVVAVLGLGALAACSQSSSPPASEVVATVDGKPVLRNTFEQYVAGVTGKPVEELTILQRDTALDNLVRAVVVANESERSGLAARPEVAGTLELQRLVILERASAENHLKDRTPSEEELRAEYDLAVAEMGKTQYRLGHILVDTQQAATALITQLNGGANFAALAKANSRDSTSSEQGGDLPWATPNGMPASFAAAVKEMKKGEVFKTPLRTDAGWHVVRLLETRDTVPPPFESVQQELIEKVRDKQYQAYTDSLVEKAKITKTP